MPLDVAIGAVGLDYLETYVLRSQNTISQYITTSPILGICLVTELRQGERVTRQWWDHSSINFGQESRRAVERMVSWRQCRIGGTTDIWCRWICG